jgi:hypothetical protein
VGLPALPFLIVLAVTVLMLLALAADAAPPDVPEAEKALLNTVDPWGLAFSDQLVRFQGYFSAAPEAPFALGLTHDLVKVWPNKYWFRGDTVPAGAQELQVAERWAAAGETQSFQVAVLPRMGAREATYRLAVDAPGAQVQIFREVFVRTSAGATYPRFASDRWPDPLLPQSEVRVSGTDCGVFWVDITLPADLPSGTVQCTVTLTDGTATARARVPIRVVGGLTLDPKAFPLIAWFRRQGLDEAGFRGMCSLVLAHHVVPVDALKGTWDPAHPERFDELHAFLESCGQRMFEVDRPGTRNVDFDSLYAHLKEKGWLANTWVYSNQDEPDDATFVAQNIPFMQMVRSKYPGIRVYLASDWHANMEQGCDAWMTDLSASGYDPVRHKDLKAPVLWHYYCHLPVRWQMRAPLVEAPNMQIDNPALEHRLALWMSRSLGAQAVFIWAGYSTRFADDLWQTLTLSDQPSNFPYAGVHNGNGWLVYPAPSGGGVVPSLRLKILRDGMEDLALLEAVRQALDAGRIPEPRAAQLRALLNPVPGLFVHPHYFDRLPETLLARRQAILEALTQP